MSLGIVLRNFIRLGYNGKLVQHPFGKKKKKKKKKRKSVTEYSDETMLTN